MTRATGGIRVPYREPNGRLSRTYEAVAETATPTAARRLRDAALRGMASPEWGTELGRLFLAGNVNAGQYVAGKRWASTVARYHEAIGADAVAMAAGAFERVDPASDLDPESQDGRRRLKLARQAIAEMQAARHALLSAGKGAEHAVRAVCEAGSADLGWGGLFSLCAGLSALAALWAPGRRHPR